MAYFFQVSVIIPVYQDWNRLKCCIKALELQNYPSELYEIIVVNNDAADRIPELDLANNLKIISEPKPGSYSARNAGLSIAKGEIIAFTDSDCIPEKNWIKNAIERFQTDNSIERVAGPINIFRAPGGSWLPWKYESITAFNQKHNVMNGVSVTANLFVRKSVFDRVGIFNASLLSGGDIGWSERATEAGVNLFFSERVVVAHPARKSLRELIRKSRRIAGGGFFKAKEKKKVFYYMLWYFLPPARFAKILISDGRSFFEVLLAILVFWSIKLLLIFEVIRLSFGGKPLR